MGVELIIESKTCWLNAPEEDTRGILPAPRVDALGASLLNSEVLRLK